MFSHEAINDGPILTKLRIMGPCPPAPFTLRYLYCSIKR